MGTMICVDFRHTSKERALAKRLRPFGLLLQKDQDGTYMISAITKEKDPDGRWVCEVVEYNLTLDQAEAWADWRM